MQLIFSKRTWVRILTFLIALILTLSLLCCRACAQNRAYAQRQQYGTLQAVEDLYTHLSGIGSALTKGVYCASPRMLSTLSATLWRDAGFAKASIARLPIDTFELGGTYKFIAQVGDYALSLARKVGEGETMTAEEAQTLTTMKTYCDDLLGKIFVLQEIVRQGGLTYDDLGNAAGLSGSSSYDFGTGFQDFEETLGEFPSLIYNGPFSDHILQKEPTMLQNRETVSREDARAIAAKAAGCAPNDLKDDGDEEGKMPSYCFRTEDDSVAVGVTKAGGFVTYFTADRSASAQKLSPEEGVAKAEAYCEAQGITSIRTSYYEIGENIISVNFAYERDNVIYYPDLIKVSVSLETGEVVSFHQRGYLSNHRERTLKAPSITQEQAAKKLSPLLTVESVRLALIPTDNTEEQFCYEFSCKGQNGESILVYLNTQTGEEEQILILLIGENGTLTV